MAISALQLAHGGVYITWAVLFFGALATFKPQWDRRRELGILFSGGIALSIAGTTNQAVQIWGVLPGLACLLASLALFSWARAAISGRFFSYLGSRDTPQFVFTGGPYAYLRHPFYTSYLLALLAGCLMFPGVLTLAGAAAAATGMYATARFEEGKFADSPLAAEYDAYKRRTGRFFPKL